MKLLNLLLKMMIVLHFQQATGHFNLELTVEKRNWFAMCLATSIFRILMINIDLDSHQLHKITIKQFQVKVYTKLRELRIIKIKIVVKELNKIIVWKEVLAKICRLKIEIVIQENHFRIKRKTNLLKVTWTIEHIELQMSQFLKSSRLKQRSKEILILQLTERSNNLDKATESVLWRPLISSNQLTTVKVNQDILILMLSIQVWKILRHQINKFSLETHHFHKIGTEEMKLKVECQVLTEILI